MKIEIRGIIETSLLDWEGKVVTTLFVPRCNFRCPFCQNADLILNPGKNKKIPLPVIIEHLLKYKKWLDGICLTGGEPCLYEDIDKFLHEIKQLGFKVKLDTNGSFPDIVRGLISNKLVDFIAMDIKAPLEDSREPEIRNASEEDSREYKIYSKKYEKVTGVRIDKEKIEDSIHMIMESGIDYEFRTTVVPTLHTIEDILAIAKRIKGARKYCLQNFSNREPMDKNLKEITPYKKEELEEMKKPVSLFVVECAVRG
jgi:pyruvate formate lyase activating enzyme